MDDMQQQTIVRDAIRLAESWQDRANELLTKDEKGMQGQMKRLLNHPMDKVVLTCLIDQSFRSHDNSRIADQVITVLRQYGSPHFFSRMEKFLIQIFQEIGGYMPDLMVPKMIEKMREHSSRTIIPGELEPFHAYLDKRRSQGIRVNVNHLGEAVLGEAEAHNRLESYIRDLKDPDIEYISVKISTIYSQINSFSFDHSVEVLKNRLAALYRVAQKNYYNRSNGVRLQKFINLDMEEYRDMEITYQAFIQTLSREEFLGHCAGIVLQAYLPDSHLYQQSLTEWARQRVAAGGAPVKLRIVKGANLEMERLESSLNNWPLATYDNKRDVDANYKRMVAYGMQPENIKAVNLGIASHNLFELAYASQLARAYQVRDYFYFEMLEGMANHVRRALSEMSGDVLLYAPVATKEEFINAIAYLIRRLDENTAPDNYLRYAPDLKVGSPEWEALKEGFVQSCDGTAPVRLGPSRIQDRRTEQFPERMGTYYEQTFYNEPDTDWSLGSNRQWAKAIRERWKKKPNHSPVAIPVVVGASEIFADRETSDCMDPNQFPDQVILARCALASPADGDRALKIARRDPDGWRRKAPADRHEILSRVAGELRRARGELIGAAAADTGKVFTETDVEVSEAIDFAEFYPFSARTYQALGMVEARGRGVGLVITPWNFPVAIPCGGIVASLAAGNTVIFKPASHAVVTAWALCQCFWRAGVSQNVLQFLPCNGATVGAQLAASPEIDFVILTGGTDTGLNILTENPGVYLAAETGGKNATIVTDMADRDQAIKNVLYSAFGNAGQKCSATSLLILEKPVYDDAHFKQQLVDAAKSLKIGPAWAFENKIATLIKSPAGDLKRALTTLEPGETWALKPENKDGNPTLWTPGIKYGVSPGGYTHMTEFFGPLLGVMCADDLDHAIALVNQTGYGLTAGIESLDQREVDVWKAAVRAGNLYVNRGTTGAITLRQPFGGMGKSALGPGIKAGGPDYVAQFMDFREADSLGTNSTEVKSTGVGAIETDSPLLRLAQAWRLRLLWGDMAAYSEDILKTLRAIRNYLYQIERVFSRTHDFFHLRGQDNVLRYLPIDKMLVRIHPDDSLFEVLARIAAARAAGCCTIVSMPEDLDTPVCEFLNSSDGEAILADAPIRHQTDRQLIDMIPEIDRIRYAAPDRVPMTVFTAAARTGFYIARAPVMVEGRIELLQYYRQQSICNNYHRYGNLGERGLVNDIREVNTSGPSLDRTLLRFPVQQG